MPSNMMSSVCTWLKRLPMVRMFSGRWLSRACIESQKASTTLLSESTPMPSRSWKMMNVLSLILRLEKASLMLPSSFLDDGSRRAMSSSR